MLKSSDLNITVLHVQHVILFIKLLHSDIDNIHLSTHVIFTHTFCFLVIYTQSVITCSTGVSSLYMCMTQPQRGCLWSPHINRVAALNHSCGCSGGSVRPGL